MGRCLKAMTPLERMSDEDIKIIHYCNEYISSGTGVCIPRSNFHSMVCEVLTKLQKESMSMKPAAMGLLHTEGERYIQDLFSRCTKSEVIPAEAQHAHNGFDGKV